MKILSGRPMWPMAQISPSTSHVSREALCPRAQCFSAQGSKSIMPEKFTKYECHSLFVKLLLKGILPPKKFYCLKLIFWIVIGSDIARFGQGRHQQKRNNFFWALPESPKPPPPLTPIRATWSFFFGHQKRRFSAYYRTK